MDQHQQVAGVAGDERPLAHMRDDALAFLASAQRASHATPRATPYVEASAGAQEEERNQLLKSLPAEEWALIRPHLVADRLAFRQVLIEPDTPLAHVWFPRACAVSIVNGAHGDGEVEVGTVASEGLVGLCVLLGVDTTGTSALVQVAGEAWRMPADAFRQLVDERPELRHLLLRYVHFFTMLLSQSVACNRLHTVDERCARRLLLAHDAVAGDQFTLTHEFLAGMLAVRRAGVSVAMGVLQQSGILRYARGHVTVLDRGRLEGASCECYALTRGAYGRIMGQAA